MLVGFRQYHKENNGCIIRASSSVAADIDWDICFLCQDSAGFFLF